ncbi:MAG: hypothetical protein C5B50_03650 [Verrucomicrobia bacterium]|nr:MAG: hypothetical protein C5B50_03650 [Verrucomicrobiota bacterium]
MDCASPLAPWIVRSAGVLTRSASAAELALDLTGRALAIGAAAARRAALQRSQSAPDGSAAHSKSSAVPDRPAMWQRSNFQPFNVLTF